MEELYAPDRRAVCYWRKKLVKEPSVAVWDDMTNNPDETALIPMSGTTTINFRNTQSFTVEGYVSLLKFASRCETLRRTSWR